MITRLTLCPLLIVVLAGCTSPRGGGADSGGDAGRTAATCATLVDSCLENQQGCVEDASGAHCAACPLGQYASPDDKACMPVSGTLLSHEFADFTVGPGEEVLGSCQSWSLGNAEELWVNAVELQQNERSHHSNWLFVPADKFPGPDGVWKCDDRGYTQLQAALLGGVLYAQSTQAVKEVQKFPDGVAVRIPPYSKVIGDVHLLNLNDRPSTGHATLRIYSIATKDVTVKLSPFHLTYDTLDIPAKARSRFFGECDIDAQSQTVLGTPLAMKVYFVLPHTHALGQRYFLQVLGGPNDGETIIDVSGFNSEARGRYYAPPVDLTGAKGFRFGCEFENPRTDAVHWGYGDQEMCENLGFAASDMAFESSVKTVNPAGKVGDMQTFTGDCSTVAFKFDQTKAGGPPP